MGVGDASSVFGCLRERANATLFVSFFAFCFAFCCGFLCCMRRVADASRVAGPPILRLGAQLAILSRADLAHDASILAGCTRPVLTPLATQHGVPEHAPADMPAGRQSGRLAGMPAGLAG